MSNQLNERLQKIDDASLDTIFRTARTSFAWLDEGVSESTIRELYDLVKLGPTSANLAPARFVFVTSPESKQRLLPALLPGNVAKTDKAPVTVIVAYDTEFYAKGPELFPQVDIQPWFAGQPEKVKTFGHQNGNLQAAYLIVAARALGLAAGPMGGFSADAVDAEFFPDGKWKTLLLINLGYPDVSGVTPRLPRLGFEDATVIV